MRFARRLPTGSQRLHVRGIMTSRSRTGLLTRAEASPTTQPPRNFWGHRLAFGAIGWPWLLVSLWGGTASNRHRIAQRLGLAPDALPHLGSWKADAGFLHRIIDAIEELQPATVVELGAGASSLVAAAALKANGGGALISYDQHGDFVQTTRQWLNDHGLDADIRHAPLAAQIPGWDGTWYQTHNLPDAIDLIIIDGPPWTVHPFIRGAAESLFSRLTPGGIILLDDAARPGERLVARRWRRQWPDITFQRLPGSTKGTLIGRRRAA